MGVGETMTGRLYGIGVGPGDPELMTLKAARVLADAPVIAYLAPDSGESTARAIAASFIRADALEIVIRVPMRPGEVAAAIYDAAAERIAAQLDAGRDVAARCEGDPIL
jgi:precorrin-2/cobalt-factor-2 C20-methyltransferase